MKETFYSQFGEDKRLWEIFGHHTEGVCVEVGGFDGITGSNTLFFERVGWQCLVVEPIPDLCRQIRSLRKCDIAEVAASDSEGTVTLYIAEGVETLSTVERNAAHFERMKATGSGGIREIQVITNRLSNILQRAAITNIDFMTIDVEGHELAVLKGLDFSRFRPRIMIIEDNSLGADTSVKEYLREHSYVRFLRTGCNDWYAHRSDALSTTWNVTKIELQERVKLTGRRVRKLLRNAA